MRPVVIHTQPRGSYLNVRNSALYGKEVLLSNWSDRRYGPENNSNSILPGLGCRAGCEKHRSECQDKYTQAPFEGKQAPQLHAEKLARAYRNNMVNTVSKVHMTSTPNMLTNFTTTHTLMFEVLPRLQYERCMEKARAGTNGRAMAALSHFDTLDSYGNQTQTGSRKRLRCAKLLARTPIETTYSAAYAHRDLQRSKPKPVLEFGPDYDGVVKFDLCC